MARKYLKMPRFWVQKIQIFRKKKQVCLKTQNGPKMVLKWSQNGPKMVPKWCRKWFQWSPNNFNGPKMVSKWSQNGPKWSQRAPKRLSLATLAFSAISAIFCNFGNFRLFGNFCNFDADKPRDFHAFFSRPIFSNALGPAHALPRLP